MKRIECYFLIFIIYIFSCNKDGMYPKTDTIINVPYEISTIQEAIDVANDFDTIEVSNGSYVESIIFNGKRVYLTSPYYRTLDTSDIVNTVLKGKGNSVVRFLNHEDSSAVLDGFTLTGGSMTWVAGQISNYKGGGIYIKGSNPTLKNLIIENNSMFFPNTMGLGGGIYCDNGSIKATNIKIRNNRCGGRDGGGGIYASNSVVFLDNCEIINNYTFGGEYFCGGVYFSNINFKIENSKIENNKNKPSEILPPPGSITAIGIYNSVGSFVNTIINDILDIENSNIKYSSCIINNVVYP